MAITVTHTFVSPVADEADPNEVGPDEWNAAHTVSGAADEATQIIAGAGLTGGGTLASDRTLDVGAGTGITVAANDVGLDTTHARNVDHTAVTLTAGAGLTGGGDISANRTFTVGAGTGITVNADDVALTVPVTLANGGTGASMADPGADRILGWDDSDGTVQFFPIADFTLEAAPAAGDVFLAYTAEGALVAVDFTNLPGASGGLDNVVEDLTPQLGGDLDANTFSILFDDNTGIQDQNDNELVAFQTVTDAVNYFDFFNSATGNAVAISAAGDDTDVGLKLSSKGAGTVQLAVNGTNEVIVGSAATTPAANDGNALGTTSLGWSDLHLATGGVINWANGEVTITETNANTLTVAGATSFAITSGNINLSDDASIAWSGGSAIYQPSGSNGLRITAPGNTAIAVRNASDNDPRIQVAYSTDSFARVNFGINTDDISTGLVVANEGFLAFGSGSAARDIHMGRVSAGLMRLAGLTALTNTVAPVIQLRHATSGTPAAGIGTSLGFEVETAADNYEIGATIEARATDVTSTAEIFAVDLKTMTAGAAAATRQTWTATQWLPGADDAIQIGSTSLRIADIFLAEGAVINWDNGDLTLTQTGNNLDVAGGTLSVGGSAVYSVGGTDVALADGGTGASLADPGADRIMFWDDSAGAVDWLTNGNGLTITTTTIAVDTASETVDGILEIATNAENATGTDTGRAVVPSAQRYHPSAAKFWVYWTANSTTILASDNMDSIADTAVGDADGTITTDFSSANWAGFVCTNDATANGWDADSVQSAGFNARAAGTFGVLCGFIIDGGTAAAALVDPQQWQAVGFGTSA